MDREAELQMRYQALQAAALTEQMLQEHKQNQLRARIREQDTLLEQRRQEADASALREQQLRQEKEAQNLENFQKLRSQHLEWMAVKHGWDKRAESQAHQIQLLTDQLEAEKHASKQSDRREQERWITEVQKSMSLEMENKRLIEEKRELEAAAKKKQKKSN